MFNQKPVEVNIGDVFVEYFHNKKKILSMMGLSKDFEISNFQNLWTVVRINNFSGYPHAELHDKRVAALELSPLMPLKNKKTTKNIPRSNSIRLFKKSFSASAEPLSHPK